jgi:hypothetical protein
MIGGFAGAGDDPADGEAAGFAPKAGAVSRDARDASVADADSPAADSAFDRSPAEHAMAVMTTAQLIRRTTFLIHMACPS